GLVAETVYHVLRHRRRLARLAGSDAAAALAAAAWLELGLVDSDTLTRFGFTGDARAIAHAVNEGLPADAPFADRASLPDWLADALSQQFGESEAAALADALNRPAPVDLRVNPLKTTREALAGVLAASGHPAVPTPWSPQGLRREDRAPLFNLPAFREGLFEVQDEGSQLIGLLTAPQPGERVLDLCAGAGGKTLHLGALMQGRGAIVACDVSARRLDQLKPRLARAGLSNVRLTPIRDENDAKLKRLRGGFDRVLVDAPCSGTGTLRRNPDIKWRALELDQLLRTQAALLDAAARLVKPGGRLVYATCSLLDAENAAQIDAFLARHPEFRRMPVADSLREAGIDWPPTETDLRLLPHRHGTDGFYAAVLARGETG
ncbi:MAG: RsmB/NOP family class I SAM-dependent RNA methyltransferase, partial [Chromatiales bacterium]|nr:RsmB/NOP family class I SAM-dependent RNA methyltransferase [Chromatiales bacterium]